jgi:hypothetical protein
MTCPLRGYPALLGTGRGSPTGHPCPAENAPHPCGAPDGLFPPVPAMLGGVNGKRKPHDHPRMLFRAMQCGQCPPYKKSNGNRIWHPNPFCCAEHRSPLRIRPEGERQGCRSSFAGQGWPVERPPQRTRSAGYPEGAQQQGGLSFGDFSLARQRKVTRSLPPGKEQNNRTNEAAEPSPVFPTTKRHSPN